MALKTLTRQVERPRLSVVGDTRSSLAEMVAAGLGAPSHAAEPMELGADAVLVNTALAVAEDPNRMAAAFRMAVEAGRTAYEVGLGASLETASPTSPLTAFLD